MEKLQKICITLVLITVMLPLLFVKKVIHHYTTIPDVILYEPRFELFLIPLGFIILYLIIIIWEKEINKLLP